jgi:hypothetical protein
MRDPGDGTIIGATNISIMTYAGDGLWSKQEDIYNPMKFLETTMAWCKKAEALGTLPEVAEEWMRKVGGRGRR